MGAWVARGARPFLFGDGLPAEGKAREWGFGDKMGKIGLGSARLGQVPGPVARIQDDRGSEDEAGLRPASKTVAAKSRVSPT